MMNARRVALVAAAALGLAACVEVKQEELPSELVFATFVSPNIPSPNDLVLRAVPTLTGAQFAAQKEFLQAFINAGGFPSDQEVTLSIPFRAVKWDPNATNDLGGKGNYVADTAPTIDPASVTASTVTVLKLNGTAAPTVVEYDIADADPATAGVQTAPGVLTLRKKADAAGSRRWDAGARYVFAVRGGPSGVKTTTGKAVAPDSAIQLAIPNRDLTKKENQPLGAIPDSNKSGSNADEITLLEGVRQALWTPVNWKNTAGAWTPDVATGALAPFQAVATVWPVEETVSAAGFNTAASAGPVVLFDSGSGVVPLPNDLLRTDADGTVITNPAFGAAAAGLTTLDGFSTTAMMLAQTSSPIDASTVNGANVFLYAIAGGTATMVSELKATVGGGGNPATAGYVAQPSALVTSGGTCPIPGGCSVAIGLQPAVPAPLNAATTIYLPPLRSNTMYAIVVTNRVKGVTGAAMAKPTVGKIVLDMTNEPATPGAAGVSLLSGVSNDTARGLRDMRANLAPVWTALPAGTTKADVAMAYTFKTQTVPNVSLSLAAAPYGIETKQNTDPADDTVIFTPTAAPTAVTPPPTVPTTGIAGFYNVKFNSLDLIDKASGAFRPTLATDLTSATVIPTLVTSLDALVAVPNAANVPDCGAGFPAGAKCAKLVVFGHGLNGSRETMFAVASGLAQAGFVTAAIDFPLHGLRNWCAADADCTTDGTANGTCVKDGAFANSAGQGDTVRPGVCGNGSVARVFGAGGAGVGSRYFVSANFFRTRDAFRQNVFDQSALALALSRPPASLGIPQPPVNPFSAVLPAGVIVDPTAVYYEGISLGAIAGTQVLATNPRMTRGVLSVGGGTVTDVFTNSPAFTANIDALFAVLIPGFTRAKITPGDPAFDAAIAAAYLRTLNVAKWILDPADPINYAQHVKLAPLPNLLANPAGTVPQAAKAALGQIAKNDAVVPNPFNLLLYNVMTADQTFYDSASAPGGSVSHGILGTNATVQGHAVGYLLGAPAPATTTLP